MSIRFRTVLILAIASLILSGLLVGLTIFLVTNRTAVVEDIIIENNVAAVENAIKSETERLLLTSKDWAVWDDTYQFIQDLNQEYIDSNLVANAIKQLDLNTMAFVDGFGRVRYAASVDLATGEMTEIPFDVKQAIESSSLLIPFLASEIGKSGVVNLSESNTLFASWPIFRSDGSGPRMGAVVVFRYLDGNEMQKISALANLQLSITSPQGSDDTALLAGLAAGETALLSTSRGADFLRSRIALTDFSEEKFLYFQVQSDRQVFQTINSVLLIFPILFFLGASAFTVVVGFLVIRTAVNPITSLTKDIADIAEKQDPSQRIAIKRNDEMGGLTASVNKLLENLEESQDRVKSRMNQVRTVSEITRSVTTLFDPQTLFNQTVNLVQDRFNLYYVGIFIVDEKGENAVLRAGTGEAGEKMLARNHKLEVGGTSMIGWTTANQKARIALDVGKEAVRFENPLLPLTRSELAIPIISRSKALGAITLQSQEVNAFTEEDIQIFEGIADGLAIALENSNLFAQTQANLEEIRKLNRAYVSTAWQEQVGTTKALSTQFENPLITESRESRIVEVPIQLRDQSLGVIRIDIGRDHLSEQEMGLASAVADQIALALENARLLEETQARAAYERRLNTLTSEFSQKSSVNDIIRSLSRELSKLPSISSVAVHLVPESTEMSEQNRHTK